MQVCMASGLLFKLLIINVIWIPRPAALTREEPEYAKLRQFTSGIVQT